MPVGWGLGASSKAERCWLAAHGAEPGSGGSGVQEPGAAHRGQAVAALLAPGVGDKGTCRSRSSSSRSSWQAFFCVLSRAACRDAGTSLRAASGCREETAELEEGRG